MCTHVAVPTAVSVCSAGSPFRSHAARATAAAFDGSHDVRIRTRICHRSAACVRSFVFARSPRASPSHHQSSTSPPAPHHAICWLPPRTDNFIIIIDAATAAAAVLTLRRRSASPFAPTQHTARVSSRAKHARPRIAHSVSASGPPTAQQQRTYPRTQRATIAHRTRVHTRA